MTLAILFSGQGSQKKAMGLDLYKSNQNIRSFYDSLDLYEDIKEISFYGNEDTINQTKYTQPIVVAFQLALLKEIQNLQLPISFTAGVSLGEYSALVAANMINQKDCMKLIEKRASYMSLACKKHPSTMYAILGSSIEEVKDHVEFLKKKNIKIEIANYNSTTEIVVGLKIEDQLNFENYMEEKNFLIKKLQVEGAFHTSLMNEAALLLKEDLKKVKFNKPSIDIALNYTGKLYKNEDMTESLSNQVNHTTYFKNVLEEMGNSGIDKVIEVGYNNTIKKIMKRSHPNIEVIVVKDSKSLEDLRNRTF